MYINDGAFHVVPNLVDPVINGTARRRQGLHARLSGLSPKGPRWMFKGPVFLCWFRVGTVVF